MSLFHPVFTGKDGKPLFPKGNKIALQGAGNGSWEYPGNSAFLLFPGYSRVCRQEPRSVFINCQERCKTVYYWLFSAPLFLWFASTLAEELDSCQCTHCSWEHVNEGVPRVSIKLQSCAGLRCSARVARQHVNKVVNNQCSPGNADPVKDSFLNNLRDS